MFATMTLAFAEDPVTIASGTFNGKGGVYTEGWTTNGTGVGRTDCVIIGKDENITSPEVDLSDYESITVSIKARRYGTLTGSKATIAVAFDGEEIGTADASGTNATTALTDIDYEVEDLAKGKFVFTCSNATSAGSRHGAGIISIVITGVKKSSGGGGEESTVKTLYCKCEQSWWKTDGAAVGAHYWKDGGEGTTWPGVRMTAVDGETDLWKIDVDLAKYEKIIFVRVNASGDITDWGAKTGDLTIPTDDKNLYTITSTSAVWGDPGVEGEWSKYDAGSTPEPPTPAKKDSIYFVNVKGWDNPRVHLWGGTAAGTEWPGVEMTKVSAEADGGAPAAARGVKLIKMDETAKINGYDVYKYVADKGAYAHCIFSNNGADQTADLDWTSDSYFYDGAWYADEAEIPAPAAPLQGNIWKVTAETPVIAGSHYVDEDLLKVDGVYATTLRTNARTIAGEDFTHAIQVRTDGYPTDAILAGKEKSGNTSLILTAKEDVDVTFYYNRQVVGEGGTENDNKDLIVFDQAAIATKVTGVFTIDAILEGNEYLNATKKVVLKKDHVYTVTASGTTLQLHGIKLEAHVPAMQIAGAWNVEEEGGAWILNNMTLAGDKKTASYEVELAKGDYEFKVLKDGAWLTKANDGAYGLHREWPGVAGVTDDAANNLKLTADAAGKYTFTWTYENDSIGITFPAPEPPAKYYIVGNAEVFGGWSTFIPVYEETFEVENLAAGDYAFRLCMNDGVWTDDYGFAQLTVKPEGVSTDDHNNICFKLKEASNLKVTYKPAAGDDAAVFTVEANFYVPAKKDLFLVPGVWAEGSAKINAWIWGDELAGRWAGYFAPKAENNDTLTLKIEADADSIIFVRFKADADVPTWDGGEGYIWNTIPKDTIDKVGMTYTITDWEAGTWKAYVAPVPVLANGYYLIGQKGWDVAALSADLLFAANPDNEGEYQLSVTLVKDEGIKVVRVESDVIKQWYPDGEGNEYKVDDAHAGQKTIYFKPDYVADWAAFGGYIYIEANQPTGLDQLAVDAKAVKAIIGGQLFIIRNGKTYTAQGVMVR